MREVANKMQSKMKSLFGRQIFIPIAALLALALFNLIADPSFFAVEFGRNSLGNPVLSGNLISIIDYGSELAILAIGMTLVTAASGGQDISVGATIAVSGSVVLRMLNGSSGMPIIVAFLVGCIAAMLCGVFNGVLVAYFKIQPMVATLILFTAGRSIAAWINNNELPIINDPVFSYFGGFFPGIPIPSTVFIALACMIVIALVLRFTNLRLYTQSVGINASSARLNGLNPQMIKLLSFVILGVCRILISIFYPDRLIPDILVLIGQHIIGRVSIAEAIHINLVKNCALGPVRRLKPRNNLERIVTVNILCDAPPVIKAGKLSRMYLKIVNQLFVFQLNRMRIIIESCIRLCLKHQMLLILVHKKNFVDIILRCTEAHRNLAVSAGLRRRHVIFCGIGKQSLSVEHRAHARKVLLIFFCLLKLINIHNQPFS